MSLLLFYFLPCSQTPIHHFSQSRKDSTREGLSPTANDLKDAAADRRSICFQSRGTVGLKDKRSAPTPHQHPHTPHPREGLLTALLLWVAVKHSHMLSCCWKVEATKIERGKMLEKKRQTYGRKGLLCFCMVQKSNHTNATFLERLHSCSFNGFPLQH